MMFKIHSLLVKLINTAQICSQICLAYLTCPKEKFEPKRLINKNKNERERTVSKCTKNIWLYI